jgi:tetratricopeptide (TPR) repeat protein
MNSMTKCALCLLGGLFLLSCSHANHPSANATNVTASDAQAVDSDRADFNKGYELFEGQRYGEASPYFYNYLSTHSPDDVDYEWGEFFFGICLKRCGFSHAAVDVLSHLVTRKPNPQIVSYCLEILEEITRIVPFDEDLVILRAICDQEYAFVDENMADFINYHQGVFDWQHGFFEWGNQHFSAITPGTYYYYKYQYQKALYHVYQDRVDDAIAILKEILKSKCEAEDIRDEAYRTLARLFYEKGQLDEARTMYQQIKKSILDQAENLLERAWAHYRLGHAEKAMGLLYAFEAPRFKDCFAPEYYILKSFIYKDVCHYQRALAVVQEFKRHYSESLDNIYRRGKASTDHDLLLVLLGKRRINKLWQFLQLLEKEKEACKAIVDAPLSEYLAKMYDLEIAKIGESVRTEIEKEYEDMANELLTYEEQAHLLEYEIGLDMSQRVHDYHYGDDTGEQTEAKPRVVVYPFQGEFWNDELVNYEVTLPDKCHSMEEWDIFFK